MDDRTCGTCRWFEVLSERIRHACDLLPAPGQDPADAGDCLRYPPVPVPVTVRDGRSARQHIQMWTPNVMRYQRCGEWAERPSEVKP